MAKVDAIEIIKKSFQIFFKSPLVSTIFILPVLLSILMFLVSFPLLIYNIYPIYAPAVLLALVMIIFALWLSMVGTGGIILAVEKLVRRNKFKFLGFLEQSLRNSLRLSISYSLEQLFLILGLSLFIIPGIFLAVKLSLVTPACILEKKGYGIKRSWNATKDNFWKIFLIVLIWNGVFIILGYIPYMSILNILLLPVYLTTLTLLYLQLGKR